MNIIITNLLTGIPVGWSNGANRWVRPSWRLQDRAMVFVVDGEDPSEVHDIMPRYWEPIFADGAHDNSSE